MILNSTKRKYLRLSSIEIWI